MSKFTRTPLGTHPMRSTVWAASYKRKRVAFVLSSQWSFCKLGSRGAPGACHRAKAVHRRCSGFGGNSTGKNNVCSGEECRADCRVELSQVSMTDVNPARATAQRTIDVHRRGMHLRAVSSSVEFAVQKRQINTRRRSAIAGSSKQHRCKCP